MTDPQVDRQIRALVEIVGAVAGGLSQLSGRVEQLAGEAPSWTDDGDPAPWVLARPEAADDDPQSIVDTFVHFYNATYVGIDGSRAKPIPACWREHPGLATEVASLACAWYAANIGSGANIRDAQQWHHQWRPGFVDRMTRDWVCPDCFDGSHRELSTL